MHAFISDPLHVCSLDFPGCAFSQSLNALDHPCTARARSSAAHTQTTPTRCARVLSSAPQACRGALLFSGARSCNSSVVGPAQRSLSHRALSTALLTSRPPCSRMCPCATRRVRGQPTSGVRSPQQQIMRQAPRHSSLRPPAAVPVAAAATTAPLLGAPPARGSAAPQWRAGAHGGSCRSRRSWHCSP